ncbi:MAG TPA: beta-propeller fold lactonase family protein [Terriglobales bacterium]|nr:beta-propeller fold lactonase family protein [Terriglobales bacterium]
MQSLALHPSNKYLYAANSGESDVSLFTISSDGALNEQLPRQTVGVEPTMLAIDPAGAYLYVANAGSNSISVFSISSSNGSLTPITQSSSGGPQAPLGLSPINMKLSPSGNVLYVTGQGVLGGEVQAFTLTSGQLALVQTPFQAGNNPAGLAVSPNGYLYTANSLDNSISEFSIGTGGALTPIAGSPIGETYLSPLALLVSNSGNFLCIANEGSSNIAVYSIGSDGSLSVVSTSPFASNAEPAFIASDPNSDYVFMGNQSSPAVQSFGLSGGSGTLTEVASYPLPGTATSIVVVP